MALLSVRHTSTYRYRQAVAFGEHRVIFRPRDSYDQLFPGAATVCVLKAGSPSITDRMPSKPFRSQTRRGIIRLPTIKRTCPIYCV